MKYTQKQMAFLYFVSEFKKDPKRFIPAWELVGEKTAQFKGSNIEIFMSYKCPTRITDIYQENPNLLERKKTKGKSGAEYYAYRFKQPTTVEKIVEHSLKKML